MAIYGTAYELSFSRDAAGAAIHPNAARYFRSDSVWAGTTTIRTTLDRGYIPYPATGKSPVVRSLSGLSAATVGGPFSLSSNARDNFAFVEGVLATNGAEEFIQRCGYNSLFIGRGRAAPGDFVAATGNLRTALINGGAATTLSADCLAGAGYFDAVLPGNDPWETSNLNGGMWTSHLGIFDFVDDLTDQATRQSDIFLSAVTQGNRFALPDGSFCEACSYASISPEGTVWLAPGDYGTSIPALVSANTANAFRNHPGVFVRVAGASYLRGVTRRWRDETSIVAIQQGSQPVGIYTYADIVTRSKWLVVIDGVADVVYINHPANTDYRRPKDIWNFVIVPLIQGTGSDNGRISIVDSFGVAIGSETRWQYLTYARFLGEAGTTSQDNTVPAG